MPRTDRPAPFKLPLAALAACLALTACGGGKEPSGNAVEMRDMEVVDGTVNDSMTDLDAVKADGVGNVDNAGSVSHAEAPKPQGNAAKEDTETVASE
ncbi:MAG: hypothetical protein J0G94_02615 [Sphingomonadales bacterium]|nr:hypothetical protein [Sphingomonadales bacterium]